MSHQGSLFSPSENPLQGKPPLKSCYVPIASGAMWLLQGLELTFTLGRLSLLTAVLYILCSIIGTVVVQHIIFISGNQLVTLFILCLGLTLIGYIAILIFGGLIYSIEQKHRQKDATISVFFSGIMKNAINTLQLLMVFIMIFGSIFTLSLFGDFVSILIFIIIQAIFIILPISISLIVCQQLSAFRAISIAIISYCKNILSIVFFQICFFIMWMITLKIMSPIIMMIVMIFNELFQLLSPDILLMDRLSYIVAACLFAFIILYFSMSMYAAYQTMFSAE